MCENKSSVAKEHLVCIFAIYFPVLNDSSSLRMECTTGSAAAVDKLQHHTKEGERTVITDVLACSGYCSVVTWTQVTRPGAQFPHLPRVLLTHPVFHALAQHFVHSSSILLTRPAFCALIQRFTGAQPGVGAAPGPWEASDRGSLCSATRTPNWFRFSSQHTEIGTVNLYDIVVTTQSCEGDGWHKRHYRAVFHR